MRFRDFVTLTEGVHDPAIFKAVIMGGPPAAGKTTVIRRGLTGFGLKELNSDVAFEYLLKKADVSPIWTPQTDAAQWDTLRARAKTIKNEQDHNWVDGRLGLIVDMTSDDKTKVEGITDRLRGLGYDVMMVFVNTANEVSRQRNIDRGLRGGRTVPEHVRQDIWNTVQRNIGYFQQLFGREHFIIVDNSEGLNEDQMQDLWITVRRFVTAPPTSPVARQWITQQLGQLTKR